MSKLALRGGTPVRTGSFPKWPVYDERETRALRQVLESGVWGTLGAETRGFAARFAKYQHCDFGVAVNSGTVTLEIILRALGVGRGDEVIIPPYTFNATASAVVIVGATPVFADIDPATFNIDPRSVEAAVTSRTKAVIPVHIGGRACDMDEILSIARRHGLYVVEDAAHAHGSEWRGKRTGSLGDAGSFSFQASKNLCAGEGGMITTNDGKLYDMCWSIHHCGRSARDTVWYSHPFIGTNARMTEWQAAILDAQMDRLDGQIARREENAAYLTSLLRRLGFADPPPDDERITRNSYHLYPFTFRSEECAGLSRDVFCDALRAEGIPCSIGYRCLYGQAFFTSEAMRRQTGSTIDYAGMRLAHTESAVDRAVWFTQNMLLGERKDMDDIAEAMAKIGSHADEISG